MESPSRISQKRRKEGREGGREGTTESSPRKSLQSGGSSPERCPQTRPEEGTWPLKLSSAVRNRSINFVHTGAPWASPCWDPNHLLSAVRGAFPFPPPPSVSFRILPTPRGRTKGECGNSQGTGRAACLESGGLHRVSEHSRGAVRPGVRRSTASRGRRELPRRGWEGQPQQTLWSQWDPSPVVSFLGAPCGQGPSTGRVQAPLLRPLSSLVSSTSSSISPPQGAQDVLRPGREKPNLPSPLSTPEGPTCSLNLGGIMN